VAVVSAVGWWYKAGVGLVPVRWVFVHDLTGTHRDDYLYSTDLTLTPQEIIERYTERWNIETTFEELRAYLGLETTRGRCAQTVLRAEPCLFGLYSLVALLYEQLPASAQAAVGPDWDGKRGDTFSDAITAVRRWLWTDWIFAKAGHAEAFAKLPEPLQQTLLQGLAPAA
jgi:Archaeal putative transposase ISC1217